MALSRRTGRSRFTLILLVLSSVTILTLDFRGASAVQSLRDGASSAFSPLRSTADKVFSPVGDAWNGVWHYDDVRTENEELRQRVAELEGQAATNVDAARQLEDLKKLQDLDSLSQYQQVTARVSSGPIANFESTIEIDKGTDAGIAVGMPVLTGAGLLGRVVQVTSSHAVVKVLTDPDFQIGVRLTSSGRTAVARGSGDGNPLKIETGIPAGTQIPADDVVTTSGLERSVFPPDITVGRVTRSEPAGDQINLTVTIEPTADLGRLSYVRVLLWEPAK
jgi:rod shape-determining protein MreC